LSKPTRLARTLKRELLKPPTSKRLDFTLLKLFKLPFLILAYAFSIGSTVAVVGGLVYGGFYIYQKVKDDKNLNELIEVIKPNGEKIWNQNQLSSKK
jgi:hypothetical protein